MYIVAVQFHGKIALHKPEPGLDNDTGGQIVFVLQACEELAANHHQVKILTRLLNENNQYSTREENHNGVQLIRLEMQSNDYKAKETLWPLIWDFADACMNHFIEENRYPDAIIGNYADAGAVSFIISRTMNIPLIFIPYSLGKVKLNSLLKGGQYHVDELEEQYHFTERIFHEEQLFQFANAVLISSEHEKQYQCSIYEHFSSAKIKIMPPGTHIRPITYSQHTKFTRKPIVLVARLSQTKNLVAPIDILYECEWLRDNAQIIIATTNACQNDESEQIRMAIEDRCTKYKDFVQFLQLDSQEDIFRLFLSAKEARGIYFNPALIEPFGLTALEAASHGLPVILTDNGGTVDVIQSVKIGYLVNVHDSNDILVKICSILNDDNYSTWKSFSLNGINTVRSYYTWKKWVKNLEPICVNAKQLGLPCLSFKPEQNAMIIVCELHGTLIGSNKQSIYSFKAFLEHCPHHLYLIYSTDISFDDTLIIVKQWTLPLPKIFICNSGIEIYAYNGLENNYVLVEEWTEHIKQQHIDFPNIENENIIMQNQSQLKRSYYCRQPVAEKDVPKTVMCNSFLDHFGNLQLLPIRASKGLVIRWLFSCWSMPLTQCIVCCNLNGSMDITQGIVKCVIVNNHEVSKEKLQHIRSVYVSKNKFAKGVVEGIQFYLT